MSAAAPLEFKNLPDFASAAKALLGRMGDSAHLPEPHQSLDWFILLANTAIPADAKAALYPCGPSSDPEATWLPLLNTAEAPTTIFGMSTYYSPIFALPGKVPANSSAIKNLARQLLKHKQGFAEARFSPMDNTSADWSALENGFKEAGWLVDQYFCFGNWFTQIKGKSFQTYFSERPSKVRNTVIRAQKRLLVTPGYQLRIHENQDENLDSAIQAFVDVYNKSWKNPEPFPSFIPGLCHLAATKAWLRLGVIEIDGCPIAAQLWLVSGGRAQIVKLAYDEAFKKLSAGSVLTAALMKHVIDIDGVSEIDYLMGDDLYKQDWMTKRQERYGLIAFNPRTLKGLMLATRHYAGLLFKYLKRLKTA